MTQAQIRDKINILENKMTDKKYSSEMWGDSCQSILDNRILNSDNEPKIVLISKCAREGEKIMTHSEISLGIDHPDFEGLMTVHMAFVLRRLVEISLKESK